MSLLEFAKNNKEYLSLFSKLTNNDTLTRSETVNRIIKQLNEKHIQLTTDTTEFELNSIPLIKYTIQRLIRGLTSSKHSNRIAFANAFSQVLLHCKWLTTAFILQTVHSFCENEKTKQSTIIESLLLIRNLFILILFQTQRIFDLSFNDLNSIITQIVISKQSKNLIDLSCQSMLCLLDFMESETKNEEKSEKFRDLLIQNRIPLIHLFCKLIPFPINSFKLVTLTQMKLIFRIYNNQNMFAQTWDLTPLKIENATVAILAQKINLVYEFVLKPIKKSESSLTHSMISNIYSDQKMWNALISLYCASDTHKFGQCCNEIFHFLNNNLLKPKYVSFVSELCNIFIHCGIGLKINKDTLFTHILSPSVLRFTTKYGLKYKCDTSMNNKYKKAFDFMMQLKLLCTDRIYGSRIKSILISSNVNIGKIEHDKSDNNSLYKTVMYYKNVFWRNNAQINGNKIKFKNQLLSSERDCVTSIKAIANIIIEFIKKNRKNIDSLSDIEWLKESIYFFVRIVFFKAESDIFNKSRFENILLSAQKSLRVLIQNGWNAFDSKHRNQFIHYFHASVDICESDTHLQYRCQRQLSLDLKAILTEIEGINDVKYISVPKKEFLKDFVQFIGVYYFMNTDTSVCAVSILSQLNTQIIDKISEFSAVECASLLMDVIISCIESDDMFISCLSRHILLEFGDLFDSNAFERLLALVSPKNDSEQKEEVKLKSENESEESDSESESEMDEENSENESDSGSDMSSDDFDITDYGAFDTPKDSETDKDINLETDTVNSAELEQLDQALIAVFREKEKQSKTRINAKRARIQRRVFHHLLLFAKQYETSPILLIILTPLMSSFWNIFGDENIKNNNVKSTEITTEQKQSDANVNIKGKHRRHKMRTMYGVPLWRFDNKLKEKQKIDLNIYGAVAVINQILLNAPHSMVNTDREYNEIKIEWLKDLIYDIIEMISESVTFTHEMYAVRVLCYVCKVYQLKCAKKNSNIWSEIVLNDSDSDSEMEIETENKNRDILWLYELWYFELKFLMKQPRKTWYFSREFFDVLMRKNALICWKLLHEALGVFEKCKNTWSQTQIFLLIGNVSSFCDLENDSENECIKCVLKGMTQRLVTPLKECLSKTMDPTKKMSITQNIGLFVRRLNKYKIEGSEKKQILNILGNSKLQWKKVKDTKKQNNRKKYRKNGNKTKKKWSKKGKNNKGNKKNKNIAQKRKIKQKDTKRKNVTNPKKKRKLN